MYVYICIYLRTYIHLHIYTHIKEILRVRARVRRAKTFCKDTRIFLNLRVCPMNFPKTSKKENFFGFKELWRVRARVRRAHARERERKREKERVCVGTRKKSISRQCIP